MVTARRSTYGLWDAWRGRFSAMHTRRTRCVLKLCQYLAGMLTLFGRFCSEKMIGSGSMRLEIATFSLGSSKGSSRLTITLESTSFTRYVY
jgi:hypothetical protein